MKKIALFLILGFNAMSQQLTVEKIMQDPKWMGTSPSNVRWAENSQKIYFDWNPDAQKADSLYAFDLKSKKIEKVQKAERLGLPNGGAYNQDFTKKVFEKNGDLFLLNIATNETTQLTQTIEAETNPKFVQDDKKVVYQRGLNVFVHDLATGQVQQLSNFQTGAKKAEPKPNEHEAELLGEQLKLSEVLKDRKEKKDLTEAQQKAEKPKQPKAFYVEEKLMDQVVVSPTLKHVCFRLTTQNKTVKNTFVPTYVTESGFTEELRSRPKVGAPGNTTEAFIYDVEKDTVYAIQTKALTGLLDKPDFYKDYVKLDTAKMKPRKVVTSGVIFSEKGENAVLVARSLDNKDRWICELDLAKGAVKVLDRQRDEAWIGGPGMGFAGSAGTLGFIDKQKIFFQSEETGYSHLYVFDLSTRKKEALTQGKFEVQQVALNRKKTAFYLQTNAVHPGEQHGYRLDLATKKLEQLTTAEGANEMLVSPDESHLAVRYSNSNTPWELYFQKNEPAAAAQKLTESSTAAFKGVAWQKPKVITFTARDGKEVFARVFEPSGKVKNKKAVIFVHGAGYLQNAHKWWSQYFREYMFHNLLVEKGYVVLDVDYRASAGYGRDTRTGIYRHMGGKDLTDHVDAAKLLVEKYGVDKNKIGIYGGSYGGFITLMAMFNEPNVFKAGAALRPVTDWAAYNHGYTSNILNEPHTDSLAYRRSSPIYFAEGLKGHLLICHGMVDVNVHFQDAVRLQQRLIELGKNNWEMAAYPLEDHGFVEPSSWTDEYKRILKLFEEKLN